ncbi:MAG: tryptophanase [Planctomycetota bacterium]|jgi:tryptophanase
MRDLQGFRTIIEPFRIKMVESIPMLSRVEREQALERAGYNLFNLHADEVTIDLLTDSGAAAMSSEQWAGMMRGDESYAGGRSYFRLREVVQKIMGFPHFLPVHQGRAAERILAHTVLEPGSVVVANTHFDTTRANIEQAGCEAIDLPIPEAFDLQLEHPFKGNLNVPAFEALLDERASDISLVMLTLTNNSAAGQPVSMANIEATAVLCKAHKIPLFIDAARYAENAWFIHEREEGYHSWTPLEIAQRIFSLADGAAMSAKKDAIINMGGLLCTRIDDWAQKFKNQLILGEGFPTYGGLAGRDLEAMAIGLMEGLDPRYLRYRARTIGYFADGVQRAGIPVVRPPGGHAIYLDAGALFPHVPKAQFPAQALTIELYREGGVRGVEVGSLMFPGSRTELVRLALPRRVYTQAHVDYVIEVAERVAARAAQVGGYEIVEEPPFLRHFTARLRPVTV